MGAVYSSIDYWDNGVLEFGSNYMQVRASGSNAEYVSAITKSMIDLSKYNYLNVVISAYSCSGGGAVIGVKTDRIANIDYHVSRKFISTTGITSLDISSISGSYYIDITSYEENSTVCNFTLDSVYLS